MPAKKCKRCGYVKDYIDFHRWSRSSDDLKGYCKQCVKEHKIECKEKRAATIFEKVCKSCEKNKPIADFDKSTRLVDGFQSRCRQCRRDAANRNRHPEGFPVSVTEKRCGGCGYTKPSGEFDICRRFSDGLGTWCRKCKRESNGRRQRTVGGYLGSKWRSTKHASTSVGREFSITINDLLDIWKDQDGKCFYTRVPMEHSSGGRGSRNLKAASIDRVDSSRGYTRDNVVLCTWLVNRVKNDLSLSEFVELCKMVSDKF